MAEDEELQNLEFPEAALRLQEYDEDNKIRIEGDLRIDPAVSFERFKDSYSMFSTEWVNEYSLCSSSYTGWSIPVLEDEASISEDIDERALLNSLTGEVKEYEVGEEKRLGILIEDYEIR